MTLSTTAGTAIRESHRPDRVPAPASADPNHHLWRNGRLWWLSATIHVGGTKQRIRRTLGTPDVGLARKRRDSILGVLAARAGIALALRFEGPRNRGSVQFGRRAMA